MQPRFRIVLSLGLICLCAPAFSGSSLGVIDLADPFQPRLTLEGEAANDAAGRDVAGIGDFNGDGYGDVVVGAFRHDTPGSGDAGAAYLVFGGPQGIPADLPLSSLDGDNGFKFTGRSVSFPVKATVQK